MGASSSTINPTQDFLARMGGGRLFDMGASAVKYGTLYCEKISLNLKFRQLWKTKVVTLLEVVEGSIDTQHATKLFANDTHWKNWRKFSPSETFHINTIIIMCIFYLPTAPCLFNSTCNNIIIIENVYLSMKCITYVKHL